MAQVYPWWLIFKRRIAYVIDVPITSAATRIDAVCSVATIHWQSAWIMIKTVLNWSGAPHSLRRLIQIVCQIVKKVGWENEFSCDGVSTLSDFSDLVNQLDAVDPVFCAVHSGQRHRRGGVPS